MTRIVEYHHHHFEGVDALWQTVFPDAAASNRAEHAIPLKLALKDGLFWVALDEQGDVVGTTMAGWDGHRGWLYFVATSPDHRRKGVAKALVEHAIRELSERGCGKVNLQIRADNNEVAAFYASLGFSEEPRISMGLAIPA